MNGVNFKENGSIIESMTIENCILRLSMSGLS